LGGHRAPSLIEHRAVGLMLVTGLIPTGRIPPQTNLGRRAQPCWSARLKLLVQRLLVGWPVSVAFSAIFNSLSFTARLSLSGESIPRDARQRHESSRSVFDQIFGW